MDHKWRCFFVLVCALLVSVLAGDSSKEDDGIPKNEVSPLGNLYKPKLGKDSY